MEGAGGWVDMQLYSFIHYDICIYLFYLVGFTFSFSFRRLFEYFEWRESNTPLLSLGTTGGFPILLGPTGTYCRDGFAILLGE